MQERQEVSSGAENPGGQARNQDVCGGSPTPLTDGDLIVALQSRAEKAEHALEITGDARALARFRETERERDALKVANAALSDGVLAYEAKVAALEARLAEVGPVVEAAERWLDTFGRECGVELPTLAIVVRDMRAARSLRGAGDATRPMAADMIDCPRCGRNHAAYIQGCAVTGGSDATGNGWDARGAGEGGGA